MFSTGWLRNITRRISGILIPLALPIAFDSCGSLKVRPLPPHETVGAYECYGPPDNAETIYSPSEAKLIRQGALKSKRINMESGIGMIEKTARLYVLNRREFGIALHLIHAIHFEFDKYGFTVQGDAGKLADGETHIDSRTTIGNITEEELYLALPSGIMSRLSEDKRLMIVIDDVSFDLPFACRETFREIRREIE